MGECSPPGGTAWGSVGPEKKVPKKISKVSPPPKKSARKKSKKKINASNLLYTYMGVFQKNTFFHIEKKLEKKIALQGGCSPPGGTAGGCSPPGGTARGVVPPGGLQGGVG